MTAGGSKIMWSGEKWVGGLAYIPCLLPKCARFRLGTRLGGATDVAVRAGGPPRWTASHGAAGPSIREPGVESLCVQALKYRDYVQNQNLIRSGPSMALH
jgi:hypothetical protein